MIVVDTNVIAYYWIAGTYTDQAMRLLDHDPEWTAPYLWRFEFRNVLATQMRHRWLALESAIRLARNAEEQMRGHEYLVDAAKVLDLVMQSKCSAYHCEFSALATELGVPLVTTDRQLLRDFPRLARPLSGY